MAPNIPDPLSARHSALPDVLPEILKVQVQEYAVTLAAAATAQGIQLPELPEKTDIVWACSDWLPEQCVRYPQMLDDLLRSGDLLRAYLPGEYRNQCVAALSHINDEHALGAALRHATRREKVRIAWRDLAGWADLDETLRELSWLAEACLDTALQRLHEWLCTEHGMARGSSNNTPQHLVVLAMGKLGGSELNFSSDIDLIFTYPEDGQADGPRHLSNQEYFTRLGQRLINALSDITAEGFVFRVDMRLRPYGESGPLAVSFDALEEYYQTHGREWERYALIKARAVAGDIMAGEQVLKRLRPFVYRRYLDYGTFEALREMKEMIRREVGRKGLHGNIKLGPGGIREIEFIGQAFQLIRGGREPALQGRQILHTLDQLAQRGHLPAYVTQDLYQAYIFLRRAENRLQELADQQTHSLPIESLPRAQLALAMNYAGDGDGWNSFSRALEQHTKRVQEYFDQVFVAPQTHDQSIASDTPDLTALWQGNLTEIQAQTVLAATGFDDPIEAWRLCTRLREGHTYRALSNQGRIRMDRLMPLLLGAISATSHPVATLLRLIELLETIARRTAYLALLAENPLALSQLVKLCAASPWLTRLLTRHPVLLDELLDPRTLYAPLDRGALEHDLADRLSVIADDDLEQQMEALRQFKQAAVLHVAAADVANAMPLMIVSDHLTDIAEVVLAQALRLAWNHLVARHGVPQYTLNGVNHNAGFAIIGYGKLGGIELGYGSDLDLVFLHDSNGDQQQTSGNQQPCSPTKIIDNAVFFARLGQRMIHILDVQTPSGTLYEVDMRLRPSGASGLLVSSLTAFADYQRTQAWTWEHQALVRARVVAGSAAIATSFNILRHEILTHRRDPAILRREVREMRERMRAELGLHHTRQAVHHIGYFDLKQQEGGIADIEFMVQYGVLVWACDHPPLVDFTDNIRQLQSFSDAGLMPEHNVRQLSNAYRAYRAALHRLTLQEELLRVNDTEFSDERAAVIKLWHTVMDT